MFNLRFGQFIGARAQLVLLSLLFVGLGGIVAVAGARVAEYGWFSQREAAPEGSNLTANQAERIALAYAEQQFGLVEEASRLEQRTPPGVAARPTTVTRVGMDSSPLVVVESRFFAPSGNANPPFEAASGGVWLFVFRAGGIPVAEWRTRDGTLEVQVVLSDVSGRMLQAGVTLLPAAPERAAVVR